MAKTQFRYLFVTVDGDVLTADNHGLADRAGSDGTTLVIDLADKTSTFDGAATPFREANAADWPDDEDEDEDEDDESET